MATFSDFIQDYSYLYALIIMFIGFYGARLQPKLPDALQTIIMSPVVRTLLIFLMVFISTKNTAYSLVVLICVMLLIRMIQSETILGETFERFRQSGVEQFTHEQRVRANLAAAEGLGDQDPIKHITRSLDGVTSVKEDSALSASVEHFGSP